jgi:hypothetical protein
MQLKKLSTSVQLKNKILNFSTIGDEISSYVHS